MTISNINKELYSFQDNSSFFEQELVAILTKSKLFPLTFEKLFKQISQEINTQKKKTVELTIYKLVQDGIIISIETNQGPAYFCQKNVISVFNKFINILQDFHSQFPYKTGITKSQVREFFAHNKRKKKQKTICPSLLNYIINLAHKQKRIKNINEFIALEGFFPCYKAIETNLEILMNLIRKDFHFRKRDKKEFAKQLNLNITETNKLLRILKQKGLVFEFGENMLIDAYNLQEIKGIVKAKIGKDGPTHIREFAEVLNQSRSAISPFLDFLDEINFTKRIDDKRILV